MLTDLVSARRTEMRCIANGSGSSAGAHTSNLLAYIARQGLSAG
jgi:hypothetical protein